MDPNIALAEMRAAIASSTALHERANALPEGADNGAEVTLAAAEQDQIATQRAEALDTWLSGGGFLPTAWAQRSTPTYVPPADQVAPIIGLIRAAYPSASRFRVSASDQGHYGFWLGPITLSDGTVVDEDVEYGELADELHDDTLGNLRWGAFGDRGTDSDFDVDMTTGKIIR